MENLLFPSRAPGSQAATGQAADSRVALDGMPALAMTYSPWQQWDAVYEADVALGRGTIFPGLDQPFLEGACSNE